MIRKIPRRIRAKNAGIVTIPGPVPRLVPPSVPCCYLFEALREMQQLDGNQSGETTPRENVIKYLCLHAGSTYSCDVLAQKSRAAPGRRLGQNRQVTGGPPLVSVPMGVDLSCATFPAYFNSFAPAIAA